MSLQKIEIDWDIHRLIEAERRGFGEPQYLALRRLLKLPDIVEPAVAADEGIPWHEDGVTVPHGSGARMRYQRGRQEYKGHFLNGFLVIKGHGSFVSLSAAANALAMTKGGQKTQLNGWNYWEAKFPGESEWRSLKVMRDEHRASLADLDLSL
jgi:hypothetical protein